MYPCLYLSSLWKYHFFKLSVRENKREVTFTLHKGSPILSHSILLSSVHLLLLVIALSQ